MTSALESFPLATVRLTDTWNGWLHRINPHHTALKVKQSHLSLSYKLLDFLLGSFIFFTTLTLAGVDIWIENVQGECLRIRERRQVKVGHVAIGISDQVRDS